MVEKRLPTKRNAAAKKIAFFLPYLSAIGPPPTIPNIAPKITRHTTRLLVAGVMLNSPAKNIITPDATLIG